MSASAVIFYLISAFTLGTGLLAVTTRKIFSAAIWLLFSLVGIAGIYFWMQMEFIAAVQIVIYVGGIVVLIIFSIFLTQQSGVEMPQPPVMRMIASVLAVLFGFALSYSLIYQYGISQWDSLSQTQAFNYDVTTIGTKMLSTGDDGFALPF